MSVSELQILGRSVRLGRRIGRGGEGEVFTIEHQPDYAVKIYNEARRQEREAKVSVMVGAGLAKQSSFVAFPMNIARFGDGRFAGFVMKLAKQHKPIFELYSPGARKASFPKADYRFLVRAATNVARAVSSVHASKCVIGDINHSGFLVSDRATITLIDADSFQLIGKSQRFLCKVGVPEYTPPEIQGKDLSSLVRTTNHDAFGLAVLIFQLLFMGRHPFVGSVRKGDVPQISEAIRDCRFVYAENRNVGMDQPPGTLSLSEFTEAIAQNFESAFGANPSAIRPTAREWVESLEELEKKMVHCTDNKLHYYPADASECPWCYMDDQLGMALFVPYVAVGDDFVSPPDLGDARFDTSLIWRQIEAIRAFQANQLKPKIKPVDFSPSNSAIEAKKKTRPSIGKGIAGLGGAFLILIVAPPAWIIYVPLAIWGFSQFSSSNIINKRPFIDNAIRAEQQWLQEIVLWRQRCGLDAFEETRTRLESCKNEYEGLASTEKTRLAEYQRQRKQIQLDQFLDGFQIRRAKIRGIGPAKTATLASYGIETAADVKRERVLTVPGFGPSTSKPLLQWRAEKERRFVYDGKPNAADQREIAKIRSELASKRAKLRKELSAGPGTLSQMRSRVNATIQASDTAVNAAFRRREQARVDLNYLGIAMPDVPPPVSRPAQRPTSQPQPQPQPKPRRRLPHRLSPRVRAQPQPSQTSPQSAGRTSTPNCPRCGSGMVMRLARRGRFAGRHFYGCSRFPRCRGTVNI